MISFTIYFPFRPWRMATININMLKIAPGTFDQLIPQYKKHVANEHTQPFRQNIYENCSCIFKIPPVLDIKKGHLFRRPYSINYFYVILTKGFMKYIPVLHPSGHGDKKHHHVKNRSRQFFEPIRNIKSMLLTNASSRSAKT